MTAFSPTPEDVRAALLGEGMAIPGPFGPRPLIYADYVASGRALGFIEDAIRAHVLPTYGNTHTETSHCGRRTTRLRELARGGVRAAVGADAEHAVVFTGSGATAAADKLVRALGLGRGGAQAAEAVVFVGPYEHHSNDLPWRESGARLVRVPLDGAGGICLDALERALRDHAGAGLMIGAFSAASNVTGVLTDLPALARLLHAHGAHFVCDFAAAGPYVPIRLAESAPGAGDRIDAAFLSPHKFPGGPGASGVLVADRGLLACDCPTVPGGGTVSYVTETAHRYVADPERREEAGTPGIVENIRAALVLDLKARIGPKTIARRDAAHAARLEAALRATEGVEILGPAEAARLGIFSFNIRVGTRLLHHNFVVALLNDLFGIQTRGGCSCAGPYGHALLGIDAARAAAHERAVARGLAAFRPGWARLGVNYFFDDATVDAIAAAVGFVARHGVDILPHYRLDAASGVWRAAGARPGGPDSLAELWQPAAAPAPAPDFVTCLAQAHALRARPAPPCPPHRFDPEAAALRWFWMPDEAAQAPRGAA